MGFLDMAAGAASGLGGAVEKVGLAQVQAEIQRERDARLREWHNTDTVAAEGRAQERKIADEQRLPGVQAAVTTAVGQATEDLASKNAPAQLARRVAEATAARQAEIDVTTNPKNVEAVARAEAAKASAIAVAAADTTSQLMKRPDYLENLNKLALASNPAARAQIASAMSTAALNTFKLEQEKLIQGARKELEAATTEDARKAARNKIEALEWSVAGDRARDTADATVLSSLEKSIRDNNAVISNPMSTPEQVSAAKESAARAQATYDAVSQEYAKRKGLAAPKPAERSQTGWDSTTGDVYRNGEKIGTAKTKAEAQSLITGKGAPAATPKAAPTGLINTPSISFVPGQMPNTGNFMPEREIEMRRPG